MTETPRRDTLELAHGLGLANLQPLAWAILLFLALDGLFVIAFGASPRGLADFVFAVLVLYAALRTALTNGQVTGVAAALTREGRLPWAFLFRTALLVVPSLLAFLLVGGLLYPALGEGGARLVAFAVSLVVQSLAFALFATMLVDLAKGGWGDAEDALAHGRRHWVAVTTMMLSGPAVVETVVYLTREAFLGLGLGDRVAVAGATHIDPLGMALDALTLTGSAIVSLMTAAVLLRAARLPG
ncbi:MAG: hypothetical protein ACFBWO_18355 [Paracoccaceae bacterium]